ncbi:MAG: LysR family transcriptional regulator [Rhodobacterales bacterium]
MNVRQLEAFKAVFTSGSVSLAADRLSVTQPAVSTLISNLEKSIGFQLFERINGRLVATPDAINLYTDVEHVFASLDRVHHTVEEIRTMSAGHLRVASMPGATIKILPQIITPFLNGRPDVNVILHTRSSTTVKEWVAMGLVDIGLAEMPIESKAINWEPLIQRCVCILPVEHKLAQKKVITPHDLANERLITLYSDHMITQRLNKTFKEAGLTLNTRLEVSMFSTCCNFVHEGAGISFVDAATADHYKDHDIIVRPFEPAIYFDIAIIFPANRPRSKLTTEFSQLLRDWFGQYL